MTGHSRDAAPVFPTVDDPLLRQASEGVGGPAGRRVLTGAGWWTPTRVLVAAVLLVAGLGLVQKSYCRDTGWPREGTAVYVHACYSDVPLLFRERGLATGDVPYLDEGDHPALEYPVLTGAVMYGTAVVARAAGDDLASQTRWFYDLTVVLLAAAAAVTVAATVRTAGSRPWDAALVALAPGVLLTGVVNWDLIAVALTSGALLAWSRRRPGLAGVLLGLAAATKLYPALLLLPLGVLCLRARCLGHFGRTATAAVATWAAVNLPVYLAAPEGWAEFYTFNEERPASFGSPWYVLEQAGYGMSTSRLNLVATGLTLLAFAGVAWLGLAAPRRPRLAQLAFLTVAAFLVLNKVYSPQYVLWLIPLAALARPRWRDFLVWQAAEAVYFFLVWAYLAGLLVAGSGGESRAYWLGVFIHLAGTIYLMTRVALDVLHPERDPVRAGGLDDPVGGLLDGRADPVPRSRPAVVGP